MKKIIPKIFWQAPDKSIWVFFDKKTFEIPTIEEVFERLRKKFPEKYK